MKLEQAMYAEHAKEYDPEHEQWVGPLAAYKWRHDPRYIVFMLSRYKHASKFLRGKQSVVDFGCGDAFGFPILCQEIEHVHGVDIEQAVIEDNRRRSVLPSSVTFEVHNMITEGPLSKQYQSGVSFDVLSSIPADCEDAFLGNIAASLDDDGIFVLGAQNRLSSQYSYKISHMDQSNFKDYEQMDAFMRRHFKNVLVFGMNDETLHTGRETMTQYFMAVGFGPKRP